MEVLGYQLDESQMGAIMSDGTATLVSAAAGSGKTLTILGKIKYLIENNFAKESEILCISFTNDAVNSLKMKINSIGYDIETLTFHKLSLKILNNSYSIINDNYLDFIIDEYLNAIGDRRMVKRLLIKNSYINLKNLINTFINLAKCNDIDEHKIYRFYKYAFFNEKVLLKIILDIFVIYKRELESIRSIDFNDLIILATKYVNSADIKYKYIIIDEFQDTSLIRFNLINEIRVKNNGKLFVVGDDYQSIYRFSGCDINLFINFNKLISDTSYFKLEYTYRNSLELNNVATSFIMKNRHQIKKEIKSNKRNSKPIKLIYGYKIDELIKLISCDNIMILGRNNKDLTNINHNNLYTIHKSKGLECDEVILVNSDDIPNTRPLEQILRYVVNSHDYIMYEEERRLFYVALTRTKNSIYIMIKRRESIFVKELKKDYKEYIEIIKKH